MKHEELLVGETLIGAVLSAQIVYQTTTHHQQLTPAWYGARFFLTS
jgi:hypothetical protein